MTIDIRGKQYVTVSERVQAALDGEERYTMVSAETFSLNEHHFYRVTIRIGERQYIGTAEIKFNAKPGTPDATNPVECAETSALGRALGFAGFGVVDGIASADELVRSEPKSRPQRKDDANADGGTGGRWDYMRDAGFRQEVAKRGYRSMQDVETLVAEACGDGEPSRKLVDEHLQRIASLQGLKARGA